MSMPHFIFARSDEKYRCPLGLMMRTGNGALRMVTVVVSTSFSLRPSMAMRKLCERDSTLSVTTLSSLSTMGRMLRLCGATGVRHSEPVCGTIMGPPFDSE